MTVPPRFLGQSLVTKLALAIALVAALLSGGVALVLDRYGSHAVDASTMEHMEVLASAVEGSFHVFDTAKKMHPVADILAEVGRHPAVGQLQVFDAQGVIRQSIRPEERGTQLTEDQRQPRGVGDGAALVMVRHFPMRGSCVACHQGTTVGGIRLVVRRERIQGPMFDLRLRAGFTGAGIIGAVVLVAVWLMRRMVLRPIQQLVKTMADAKDGDFLVRAPVLSQDELGGLAGAFNTMLAAITDMRAREVERQVETAGVAAEKRLAPQLEDKNRIIARQNQELQDRVRDLALLQEVTRSLTSTLSLDEQLPILSRLLEEKLGYREFTLMLLDRAAGLLRVAAAQGFPPTMNVMEMTFQVGEGIAGLVAQTGQTLQVPDTSADSRYLQDKSRLTPKGSLVSVPMVSSGMVMGVLNVFKPVVDAFRKDEVDLLENIAAQAALGIANARLYQDTVELSLTDSLTNLPNRRALDARLDLEVARATRYDAPVSILMVDVDHFKKFNDAHGHLLGDGVLRGVAQTLCQMVRKADTVARFGGEEFCIILPKQDEKLARDVAEKLRKAVKSRAFDHMDTQPGGRITISIGVAVCPRDGTAVKVLLDAADAALYAAKRAGRDQVKTVSETAAQPAGPGYDDVGQRGPDRT